MQSRLISIALLLALKLVFTIPTSNTPTTHKNTEKNQTFSNLNITSHLHNPKAVITFEHISHAYYRVIREGEKSKVELQHAMQNFLEILQRNLSTSSLLCLDHFDYQNQYNLQRLFDLADYFEISSKLAMSYGMAAEKFFEVSKNESYCMLYKLRQTSASQRSLQPDVKMGLTNYFSEMGFFQTFLSEKIDGVLEYIVDTLRLIQIEFIYFADVQREVLHTWDIKLGDDHCRDTYINFLQLWSANIFRCVTARLSVTYDVYGATETMIRFVMRQLEWRLQRLYRCFRDEFHMLLCRFLCNPEEDFHQLYAKLDEFQQYIDIKIKKGKVEMPTQRRRRTAKSANLSSSCVPPGFPYRQMNASLRACLKDHNPLF